MSQNRLYLKAVAKIQELIASGKYPPGSRLPPERQLAEEFGMSRPTVREAIIALEAKEIVSVKTGSGVYIAEPKPSRVGLASNLSAFELIELRVIVEGEAAALAATMISDSDLEEMEGAVEQMKLDPLNSSSADVRFHTILSNATKNRALVAIVSELWAAQEGLEHVKQAHEAVCMQDEQRRIAEHQAICDALRSRDPSAARTAMRQHFSRILTALHETDEERAVREARDRASAMRERYSFDRLASVR